MECRTTHKNTFDELTYYLQLYLYMWVYPYLTHTQPISLGAAVGLADHLQVRSGKEDHGQRYTHKMLNTGY